MAPANSDKKLDLILDQLKALGPMQSALEDINNSISNIREDIRSVRHDVDCHEDRIAALEQQMKSQRDFSNFQQQQLRMLAIRLLNFPVTPGEATDNYAGLKQKVYDIILKPLLTAAKADKDLATVPQLASVIEACFRPFNATTSSTSSSSSLPPPIIIKLTSKPIKIALLKHRKDLPQPSSDEKTAGIQRYLLVEDLTADTRRCFTIISKSKKTAKTWTIDGTIKYTFVGDKTVHTVKSVYDSTSTFT